MHIFIIYVIYIRRWTKIVNKLFLINDICKLFLFYYIICKITKLHNMYIVFYNVYDI